MKVFVAEYASNGSDAERELHAVYVTREDAVSDVTDFMERCGLKTTREEDGEVTQIGVTDGSFFFITEYPVRTFE